MFQSCETLIIKITRWQHSVNELEELIGKFLRTGDEKMKESIENKKSEIKKYSQEYLSIAYSELSDGQGIFWPEKEILEEITEKTRLTKYGYRKIKVRNNHLVMIQLSSVNLSQFYLDFSLFQNLEDFSAQSCQLKKLPRLSTSVREIWIRGNPGIEIPDDLTNLNNLEEFYAPLCQLKKLSRLSTSVRKIGIESNPSITEKEKQRIREEYPNAEIAF